VISGQIKIFNTINEFKDADKNKILNEFGEKVSYEESYLQKDNRLLHCCLFRFGLLLKTILL
jgi:hypothetical protein